MDPGQLEAALVTAACKGLGGEPDLWHIHNHHLGKNLALPGVVAAMATEGRHLLLQIHDFPEDCRSYNYRRLRSHLPAEYFDRCLYPQAPHIHYAVLNGRDRGFLAGAGLSESQLHWLPNPVSLPGQVEDVPNWPWHLWLYPTRAIRRKNVGELLLWAALAGPNDHFATSLAPENIREQSVYQSWVKLATELNLPLKFDLASSCCVPFPALLQSAHCLVTTSVAEGFGMAFLEPWLLERPVAGRDLPEITADFGAVGIDLEALYPRLEIPLNWIGEAQLRTRIRQGLESLYSHYGLPGPEVESSQRAWQAWVQDNKVDFGRLDEGLQIQLIRRLATSSTAREEFSQNLQVPPAEVVTHNRVKVASAFDDTLYGQRLAGIYRTLMEAESGPVKALDSAHMLHCFLQPERLHLLRL